MTLKSKGCKNLLKSLGACKDAVDAYGHLPLDEAGEDRPRVAIEKARKWAHGEATLDEMRAASAYGYTAAAAASANAANASYAAASAYAYAYTYAAASGKAAAERKRALNECAKVVREKVHIPVPDQSGEIDEMVRNDREYSSGERE